MTVDEAKGILHSLVTRLWSLHLADDVEALKAVLSELDRQAAEVDRLNQKLINVRNARAQAAVLVPVRVLDAIDKALEDER
jgi:hypothetical protein